MTNFAGINSLDSPIHSPIIFWGDNPEGLSSNDESSETIQLTESRYEQVWKRFANELLDELNLTDQELKGLAKDCEVKFSDLKKTKLIVWTNRKEKDLIHCIKVSKYSWFRTVKRVFGKTDSYLLDACKRKYKLLTKKFPNR